MGNLYIHVGLPKTGTTFLQNFMRDNIAVLNSKGYDYPIFKTVFPRVGVTRNGYFLKNSKLDKFSKRVIDTENKIFDEHFEELKEVAKKYDNIVLSEESLWNDHKFSWENLKKRADEIGLTVKMVVYLRRQDSFIQSYWSQKVKETYTISFKKFLNTKRFANMYMDYYARLEELAKILGKENLIPRVYERSSFGGTKNTLTSDFLEAIGLEETDEYVTNSLGSNLSLSGAYLETKRKLNRNPEIAVHKSFVTGLLKDIMVENDVKVDFNSSQYLDYKSQVEFLKKYEKGNKKLAKEYLHRKDGVMFKEEPVKNNNNTEVEYSINELMDICGKMLINQHNEILKLRKKVSEQEKTINKLNSQDK